MQVCDKLGSTVAVVDVGTYVEPDGWRIGNQLLPGLPGFCDYYLPTNSGGPIKELAVDIAITGRTRQRRCGSYYVRCRITFVGDCEPNTVVYGWVPAVWG